MNREKFYEKLELDRPVRSHPPRSVAGGIVLVIDILVLMIFPSPWNIGLIVFGHALTAWLATYGLDEGVEDLIRLLKRLGNLY